MARRRRRATKRRTRRSSGFNVRQAAFALGTAQIAMKGITNVGIWDFFTAGTPLSSAGISGGLPPNWTNHGNAITIKEIMAGMHLYNDGRPNPNADGITETIIQNLQANGLQMVMGIAGLKVADKLLGKAGVWRNTNKMLKAVGVKDIVKV